MCKTRVGVLPHEYSALIRLGCPHMEEIKAWYDDHRKTYRRKAYLGSGREYRLTVNDSKLVVISKWREEPVQNASAGLVVPIAYACIDATDTAFP
jgi:hypothetical protein